MSWMTLKDYSNRHPWPTYFGLKMLIWKRSDQNLPFIRRVGRRMLIDDVKFQEWIDKGHCSKPTPSF